MSKFAKKEAGTITVEGPKPAKLVKNADKAAKKPAKVKAEKAKKAPKAERVAKDDNRKITVHTKPNPHREGSGRYEAYEAVKKAKRVSDYLAEGHKPKYLARWEKDGLISIE